MIAPFPSGGTVLDRRQLLTGAAAFAALFRLRGAAPTGAPPTGRPGPPHLTFAPIAPSTADAVVVPDGYRAQVLLPWGTSLRGDGAPWRLDAPADEQQWRVGMHHDGMAFFPDGMQWNAALGKLDGSSTAGVLCVNHEYTDDGLLHPGGTAGWTAAKVRRAQAAVGVSVIRIERGDDGWQVRSGFRVSGLSEVDVAGPARGHALLRTPQSDRAGERDGTGAVGTFGNCANGQTPWGTYLTCEENVQDHFAYTSRDVGQLEGDERTAEARRQRYGIGSPYVTVAGWRSTYGWDQHDERFDADRPQWRDHCHRYGWVVEIDPRDPERRPCKRTALGRFRHENAAVTLAPDGRVVVYMGDDARFEYLYKFVSRERFRPEQHVNDVAAREHNWRLLDAGTLYAARFDAGDTGQWLPLTVDDPALRATGRFRDAGEIAVFARDAADVVGATKMDRPEWVAVDRDPATGRVEGAYVSLSNNSKRGTPGNEGPNPANPRAPNPHGHILRWRETDGDPTAATFRWSLFVLAGDRQADGADQRATIEPAPGVDDADFGSPDGVTIDPRRGVLWVQTDVSSAYLNQGEYAEFGNNQMQAVDTATGEVRRFLTGPRGCEITGLAFTPDCRTMFVNVQHPGEPGEGGSDPAAPTAISSWPGGAGDDRPRSATVIVTRADGGPIGT